MKTSTMHLMIDINKSLLICRNVCIVILSP